jgi:hypothetical protein
MSMEIVMGEITEFNPAELPIPSKVALIKRRADSLVQLVSDGYGAESGSIAAQREWMQRYHVMLPELANLSIELQAWSRAATRAEIAAAIKILRANFHNSGKNVTADTIRILADEIGSEQPTIGVLKLAVKSMIKDLEFFPVTRNVLDALQASAAFVDRVRGAMTSSLQHWHARVSEALTDSEVEEQKRDGERRRRNADHEALKGACREILGSDDPEVIRSMIQSNDEAMKSRVRARRDELLPLQQAPPS